MAYGIPGDQLPIAASGRIKRTNITCAGWPHKRNEKIAFRWACHPLRESIVPASWIYVWIGNAIRDRRLATIPATRNIETLWDPTFTNTVRDCERYTWKDPHRMESIGGRTRQSRGTYIGSRSSLGWWSVGTCSQYGQGPRKDWSRFSRNLQTTTGSSGQKLKRDGEFNDRIYRFGWQTNKVRWWQYCYY